MFLHLSVSHSVHRGEYLGRYTPGQVHPQAGTPPGRYNSRQVHPLAGTPPAGTPPRQVHPPGQVNPPGRYTPQGRYTPRAGTPPTVHAGIRSTSGRYASYWNAFLFTALYSPSRQPRSYTGFDCYHSSGTENVHL